MSSEGWSFYFFSVVLGLISYFICLRSFGTKNVSVGRYLLEGNNVIESSSSIIGTLFSSAFFFTSLTGFFVIYGPVYFFATLPPILIGFIVLYRRAKIAFYNVDSSPSNLHQRYFEVFCRMTGLVDKKLLYYSLCLVYLVAMLAVEIGIFQNGLQVIAGPKGWSQSTVLITFLVILSYVYVGGFKGVLITDVIQLFIFSVTIVLLAKSIDTVHFDASFFEIKNNLTTLDFIWVSFASFVIGFCWITCIPEIWIRIATLETFKQAKKSLIIAAIGWPLVVACPFAIVLFSDVSFQIKLNQDAAYDLWKIILDKSGPIMMWGFVGMLVTAVFTTLDTIVITVVQLLHFTKSEYPMLRGAIGRDGRKTSILVCLAAFGVGIRLDSSASAALGLYAGSIPILLFFLCYVSPLVQRVKNISFPWYIFVLPMVFDPLIINYVQDEFRIGSQAFHITPGLVLCKQMLFMMLYYAFQKVSHRSQS